MSLWARYQGIEMGGRHSGKIKQQPLSAYLVRFATVLIYSVFVFVLHEMIFAPLGHFQPVYTPEFRCICSRTHFTTTAQRITYAPEIGCIRSL